MVPTIVIKIQIGLDDSLHASREVIKSKLVVY